MDNDTTPTSPYFDQVAVEWDSNPLVRELADAATDSLRGHCELNQGMAVMEYGCGTGLIALALAPRIRCLSAWDSSPGMLEVLGAKLGDEPDDRIESRCIDLNRESPPARRFDLIYSSMALHHVEDVPALLRTFSELLHIGGALALIDLDAEDGSFHGDIPGVHHQGFKREELARWLEAAGFEHASVSTAYEFTKPDEQDRLRHYSLFIAQASKARS